MAEVRGSGGDTDTMELEPISPELVLVDPELAHALRTNAAPAPIRVAFICTGNRFRSVLAEAAFRSVAALLPVEVDSYGLLDLRSSPPLPGAARTAEVYGLRISSHVARSLGTADLSQHSLVVGFEPQHVTAAIEIAGARPERAFLLSELIGLLEHVGIDPRPNLTDQTVDAVRRAHNRRLADPARRIGGVIGDPMGMSDRDQWAIGEAVCEGAIRLARELFGLV